MEDVNGYGLQHGLASVRPGDVQTIQREQAQTCEGGQRSAEVFQTDAPIPRQCEILDVGTDVGRRCEECEEVAEGNLLRSKDGGVEKVISAGCPPVLAHE